MENDTKKGGAGRLDDQYPPIYVSDLKSHQPGEKVTITGQYLSRRDHTDRVVIQLRDITGSTFARLVPAQLCLLDSVAKFSRIRIWGRTALSKDGRQIVVRDVDGLCDLGSLKVPYRDLGAEMREYASRMFVSRIVNTCSSLLRDRGFDEFESKVISSEWVDGGLEPLQVLYPGFGSPATLITSPNAQVMDFLNATGSQKAFTVALSFTSTFRHPNNAAETRVIVAKAIDLASESLRGLAIDICTRVLDRLAVATTEPATKEVLDASWPSGPLTPDQDCALTIRQYGSDITTGGAGWRNMLLENVIHVIGASGDILVDGSIERIGKRTVATLALYPARFLSMIDAPPPRRQLSDLNEYGSWHT